MFDFRSNLKQLSNHELDRSAKQLVSQERGCQAALIAHIAEVGERKLHLDLGHSSLFTYCQKRLGLCEGTVYLRLQVAKVVRRFPVVLELLDSGRFNLTALARLSPILTSENVVRVLKDCEGMTREDIEMYVAKESAKAAKPPVLRKQGLKRKNASCSEQQSFDFQDGQADVSTKTEQPLHDQPARGKVEPVCDERYIIGFSSSGKFKKKLERLAEVLGVKDIKGSLEELLECALDEALEKRDPICKAARKGKRQKAKSGICLDKRDAQKTSDAAAADQGPSNKASKAATAPAQRRYIPADERAAVMQRAHYQCEYSHNGMRCSEKSNLEIDHKRPFWQSWGAQY